MGKTTIELDHITKGYDGRTLLRDFSYIFLKGDRIGFIGANGSGKTTLMKMIAGRIKPDAGTITVGATIKIGYYTQEIETGPRSGNCLHGSGGKSDRLYPEHGGIRADNGRSGFGIEYAGAVSVFSSAAVQSDLESFLVESDAD